MTLYLLFAGLAVLGYAVAAALMAVSSVVSRHAAFGVEFAFLGSLSMLLTATIVLSTRSLLASAFIIALMSGAAVTMMIVAAREPSAADTIIRPQQSAAVVVAAESARQQAAGEQLFQEFGCVGCHRPDGKGIGPALAGVFGSPVTDPACGILTADDEYVGESILNPTAMVIAGFAPVMPSFAGRVTEEQLRSLVAYVKSLRARVD